MKKKPPTAKRTAVAKAKPDGLAPLIAEVRNLIQTARRGVASVIDTFQVMTNYEIGRRIVEYEQKGEKRAGYGAELLKELSARLSAEFGRGFSPVNLSHMRRFYLTWQDRVQIFQKPSEKLVSATIPQTPSGELASGKIVQKASAKSTNPFTLSWSHYVELLAVKDPAERSFYEIEATNEGWSLPELRRQKASALYHRLALSRDKAGVRRLAEKGQIITKPEDVLKNPLVLEFLGLDEKSGYSESDLESAIITHLEKFLLELGKGFLFEARQKRFTFDGDHYFLDLVFYNRLLRCYLVIDLKLDKLTHQDLGQMQIYPVRYELPLRLCPPKPRRRQLRRRLHQRSQAPAARASGRERAFDKEPAASRIGLLRSLTQPSGRHQPREISQDCVGETLHQDPPHRVSHGVNVNYYDRHEKLPEENPTIGLLLCREKNDAVVELTLPKDANIHAKEYQLYLPSKELLKAKLLEWAREEEAKAR
jgi:predicted nuclease of restriction endonuclease-like (RecB) superfamily